MNPSLSFVLPVFNDESLLMPRVQILLDTLSELTSEFEILIIDDGSEDDTILIARDLVQQYPQVSAHRQFRRYGMKVITQVGLKKTRGDLVMIQDVDRHISLLEIRDVWNLRSDQQMVMVQPSSAIVGMEKGGVKMLRRRAIEQLSTINSPEECLSVERVRHDNADRKTRSPQFLVRLKQGAMI